MKKPLFRKIIFIFHCLKFRELSNNNKLNCVESVEYFVVGEDIPIFLPVVKFQFNELAI